MNFDENCLYCSKSNDLDSLMIKICDLEVSTVYLFKEQTYKGRCNVVFKEHKSEITDFNGPLLTRLNAVIYEKQSQYQQLVRQCDFQIKYSKKETTAITKLNSLLNEF